MLLNQTNNSFKYKQFEAELILWAVRWYGMFAISYRDLVIMAAERGLSVAHTTMMRWVHQYSPELAKKVKRHLKTSSDSYRVDETYVKVNGLWKYLYRAVDSNGDTLDWMLSAKRNKNAAKRFFKKMLRNLHCCSPRKINVDKAKAYPLAFEELQNNGELQSQVKLQQQKYMNNIVEQDHRFIKRRIRQSQWFQSFNTAKKTIDGYEAMHMLMKGQVKQVAANDALARMKFVNNLFGIAA